MKREKFYIVRKSVPVKNNAWQAKVSSENYVASNLNELLVVAITDEEIQKGVKIIQILSSNDGIYFEASKSFHSMTVKRKGGEK